MGRCQYFPGEIGVEEKKEAARTAMECEDRENTIWTDGPKLEDGNVRAACVWWQEEGPPPPK